MLSRIAYIACLALMFYTSFFFYPRCKQNGPEATIGWDVSGYYWYLPSLFIYKDLAHQSFKDSVLNKYRPTGTNFQQAMPLENGNYSMKYSSGMAVMYLPFFTAAHLVAGASGYPRDGFSPPYQLAIQLGGFLVSLLGLWYLRKLLLIFYQDKVVAITLLLLVFGSNYLNYSSVDCGMSHCWLFTVYVFLLLNTHYFYQRFETRYAVRIGLLVGLATLTRPTDALSCLIPLLWGLESISPTAIKNRLSLFASHLRPLLLAGICAMLVISVQLIYWKHVSGHWLVYSYSDQKLYFRSPNFMNYTFSYKSGWLVYSPMMMLAFVGLVPFVLNGKNKVAITSFFLLNYYIVCAWSIWWYGGRAMVQSYPVLMFPLASLISAALDRRVILWLLSPFVLLFLYFNVWITWHYHRGTLYDCDNMTKQYFWRVAGRWSAPENTLVLRDHTDLYEGAPKNLQLLYQHDFANDTGVLYELHATGTGKSLHLTGEHDNSDTYKTPYTGKGFRWIRVQATFHCERKEWNADKMTQFIVRAVNKGNVTKENMIRVYRLLGENETKSISLDMKLPKKGLDEIDILFWNGASDIPIWIDDLKVWGFNE